MDTESFEETRLKRDDWADFLKEGSAATLMFYNGKVISVDPPQFVELKVGPISGTHQGVWEPGQRMLVVMFSHDTSWNRACFDRFFEPSWTVLVCGFGGTMVGS